MYQGIFTFGTIACFKPQKNLFDLLRAFHAAHQNHSNIRLEIIGDGQQRTAIETWINKHNLESSIILHGWQKDVLPIMQSWDTFTLTSFWEGLPCAIIEARLLQLPVLCYDTGGISDVIEHDKNGLLYKKGDWHSLAQDMIALSRRSALHAKLSSRHDNLDDFQYKKMISLHEDLYREKTKTNHPTQDHK
jgi:glycosyltransferase involved in cell wall biosynthesis